MQMLQEHIVSTAFKHTLSRRTSTKDAWQDETKFKHNAQEEENKNKGQK